MKFTEKLTLLCSYIMLSTSPKCAILFTRAVAQYYQDMSPGSYMKLSITDTGCGMSSDVLERVFDPFFTTKTAGEGTGLGLSVVHGIVKSHNGFITVESEKGNGSAFNIFFRRPNRIARHLPKPT